MSPLYLHTNSKSTKELICNILGVRELALNRITQCMKSETLQTITNHSYSYYTLYVIKFYMSNYNHITLPCSFAAAVKSLLISLLFKTSVNIISNAKILGCTFPSFWKWRTKYSKVSQSHYGSQHPTVKCYSNQSLYLLFHVKYY